MHEKKYEKNTYLMQVITNNIQTKRFNRFNCTQSYVLETRNIQIVKNKILFISIVRAMFVI